jgi:tetratricopeptide (TPR) repeat protein
LSPNNGEVHPKEGIAVMNNRITIFAQLFLLLWLAVPAWAEDGAGQQDLDEAMKLRFNAATMAELSEVAELCESAIDKGLDAENEDFARKLLAGALYERAEGLCKPIFERPEGIDPRWRILRQVALPDLQKLVKYDDTVGEAYLLIAKLQLLPGGDRAAAKEAIEKVAKLVPDDKKMLSQMALVQSQLQEDPQQRLKQLNQSIELDPENVEAWEELGEFQAGQGDFEKAYEAFNRILEKEPQNLAIRLALSEALANLKKYDESIEQLNKAIEIKPSLVAFTLRARVHLIQDKIDEAIADLDQGLKLEEDANPMFRIRALIVRAQLYYQQGRNQLAMDDVERALKIRPGMVEAVALRSLILAAQDKLDAAIQDVESLIAQDPDNTGWQLQLATYVNANNQPRKAIKLFNAVLEEDPENLMARRGRADAFLSTGEHDKALADYDAVVESQSDDSSVLNNLAWLLATSPEESIRDGKRALEYAEKACKLTNYEQAHILSTLAAAYAELGDFDNALKWSEKAVELSDESTEEQLKNELKSYQEKKPWRERQSIEGDQ